MKSSYIMSQLSSRMTVDKKGIQVFVWKIIRCSMVALCKFAKEYPYATGVFFIFLLLYLYVPLVFYFLVFSSPVLICTAVFIQSYRSSFAKKHDKNEVEAMAKTENEKPRAKVKDILVTKSEKGLRAQKSVRRNRRNENIELDTEVNKLERKGDWLASASPFDGLLEEKHRLLEEEERLPHHGQSSSPHVDRNPDPAPCDTSAGESVEIPNSGGYQKETIESTDDEEEPSEFRHNNKAVAWTKDDEQNLMDLGLSELERNKRLESLMARRRARKLFRLAVEKTLMGQESIHPTQMALVSTARVIPFDGSNNSNGAVPQMPGSAPSVLLPGQNPFDLPYEPQEEKPNLTGDSFHREFMAANQKDMFLCRHESFRSGTCYQFEHRQDSLGPQLAAGSFVNKSFLQELEYARDKKMMDNTNHQESTSLAVGSPRPLAALESPSPKEVPNAEMVKDQVEEEEAKIRKEKDIGSGSITPEIQSEKMESSQEDLEAQIVNEATEGIETELMNDNGSCSSSSSDSDGSSIIMDEKKRFPQVLSDHVQKVLSLSTPPKGTSMNRIVQDWSPAAIERNRSEDHMFFKNRVAWHTHSQSIASDLQVEFSDIGSPPLTIDETASPTDETPQVCDEDIERAIARQGAMWGQRNELKSNEQDEIDKENSMDAGSSGLNEKHEEASATSTQSEEARKNLHGTTLPSTASHTNKDDQKHPSVIGRASEDAKQETLQLNLSPEGYPDKQEESSNPQVKPPVEPEPDVIYDVEEPMFQGEVSTSDKDDGIQVLPKEQVIELGQNQHSVENYEMSHKHHTNCEPEETRDPKQTSVFITDVAGQTGNLTEHNVEEVPEAVQSQVDSRTDFGTGDLRNVIQSSPSSVPHGLLIEQRTASSGSLTSPTSVLLNDVLARQMSEINFEQPTQMDVLDSDSENLSQSNLLNKEPHKHLTSYEQQETQQLITNSVSHSSTHDELGTNNSNSANPTTKESENKTQGKVGTNLSKPGEENAENATSSAKESSSGEVIHEVNTINNIKDQNVSEKREHVSKPERAMEIEADMRKFEIEEERTTTPKERPEAGENENAGQGNESSQMTNKDLNYLKSGESQVQEVVEPSRSATDSSARDTKHEFGRPADKEDETGLSKLEEEKNSSNQNQGGGILKKAECLLEDETTADKSSNNTSAT